MQIMQVQMGVTLRIRSNTIRDYMIYFLSGLVSKCAAVAQVFEQGAFSNSLKRERHPLWAARCEFGLVVLISSPCANALVNILISVRPWPQSKLNPELCDAGF
jgi:hypothetical protein